MSEPSRRFSGRRISLRTGILTIALVVLFVATVIPVAIPPGSPPPSNVQTDILNAPSVAGHVAMSCSAATTCISPSINMAVTKGDTIALIVTQNGTTAPSAVKDAHGSTALSLRKTKLEVNAQLEYYTGPNAGTETNLQVYVNYSGSTTYEFFVVDITATTQQTSIDATCTGTNGISTSATDSVTTITAGDLIVAGIVAGGTEAYTSTGGATLLNSSSQSTISGGVQDQIDASTGAFSATATLSVKHYWAECAMAFKPGTAPSAPTAPSISAQTNTTITWGWTPPAGVVLNNTLYWGSSACGTFPNTVSTGGAGTTAQATGLSSATQYCGKIEAWNSSGNSPFSSTLTGWTLPTRPSSFILSSKTYYSATFTWSNPTGTLTDNMFYWQAGGSCGAPTVIDIGSVVTTYTLTGLAGSTQYCTEVSAVSSGGASNLAGPAVFTTNADPAPGAPTSYALGSITTRTVATSWTQPSGGGILNDTAYTQISSSGCAAVHTGHSLGVATSYTFSTTAGTYVCEDVAAWNVTGQGTLTSVLSTATLSDAATGLSVSSVTSGSITVAWTDPAGGALLNATVYSGANSCSPASWSGHNVPTASTQTLTVSSLVSATTYCFMVQIWTAGGASNQSATVQGTTLPAAATGLTNGAIASTSIAISWTNPAGTLVNDSILWEVGTACSAYTSGHSLGSVGTSYTIVGLSANTTYCWTVVAWSSGGSGALPAGVKFHTVGVPWSPVSLATGTLTGTTAVVSWTNRNATLLNDTIYWGTSCATMFTSHSLGSAGTTYTITGLSFGTTYCWTVSSWNATGESPHPSGLSFTSLNVPLTPTGLTNGALTGSTAAVSWTNPPGTLVNDTVEWGLTCAYGTSHSLGSAGTTYTITGLSTGSTYCWTVRAWNSTGGSLLPSGVSFTTVSLPLAPTSPTYVSATATAITLTWTNPGGSLSNDTVYYQTGSSCTSGTGVSTASVVTTFAVTGLVGATVYSFTVQAWNVAGGSPQSSCVTGATLGAIPPAPSRPVTVTVGPTWTTVAWTNPAGYTILNDSILLRYGVVCGGPWNLTASLGGAATSTNVSGLVKGSSYCLEVIAWDAQSPPSLPLQWATNGNPGCGGACEGGGGGGGGGVGKLTAPPCLVNCSPSNATAVGIYVYPILIPGGTLTFVVGGGLIMSGVLIFVGGRAGLGLPLTILSGIVALAVGVVFLLVFGGVL